MGDASTLIGPVHWIAFLLGIVVLVAFDLGVLARGNRSPSPRVATIWTLSLVGLAGLFALWVGTTMGAHKAVEFATGYLLEQSLSIDNLVVIMVLLAAFRIPEKLQHRVLFWGFLGALVMRLGFVLGGAALLASASWILVLFGGVLLVSGLKLLRSSNTASDPAESGMVKALRRWIRTTHEFEGSRFVIRRNGVRYATPLLLALLCIELSDVVFALDSLPAVFGVSRDPFIVFTSNVFAVLGLRSMYFALSSAIARFRHLQPALAVVLVFIGVKMLVSPWIHISSLASLVVVASVLGGSVITSVFALRRERALQPALVPVPVHTHEVQH